MVRSSDPRWVMLAQRVWGPFARPANGQGVLVAIESAGDGWRAHCPDGWSMTSDDPWWLIANMSYALEERAFAEAAHVQDLHAAAVSKGREALVLAGRSRAGKTTLALELTRLGWRYLSDDTAPIRRESGWIVPFPKALGIKDPGSWPRYASLWGGREWPPEPKGPFCVPARMMVGQLAAGDADPRFLVFPRFEPGADLEFTELTAARALAELSQYVRELSPDSLRVLARVCRGARAATLVHGDSRAAAEVLDRWTDESAGPRS